MRSTIQAPPLPKQVFEINSRNFSAKEELTQYSTANRHIIHMILVSQSRGDGLYAVPNPFPVLKIILSHMTLLSRLLYCGTGYCNQTSNLVELRMALLPMWTPRTQVVREIHTRLLSCRNIPAAKRFMSGRTMQNNFPIITYFKICIDVRDRNPPEACADKLYILFQRGIPEALAGICTVYNDE